jgi:hypothetical protein
MALFEGSDYQETAHPRCGAELATPGSGGDERARLPDLPRGGAGT